jgi:hypothetical protein
VAQPQQLRGPVFGEKILWTRSLFLKTCSEVRGRCSSLCMVHPSALRCPLGPVFWSGRDKGPHAMFSLLLTAPFPSGTKEGPRSILERDKGPSPGVNMWEVDPCFPSSSPISIGGLGWCRHRWSRWELTTRPRMLGEGPVPSGQDKGTWLLYPQIHCPLPCLKQLIFNISIPWLIFKHGSFPDKFFRGTYAVGLGGSRLPWQWRRPTQDGCPPQPGCPVAGAGGGEVTAWREKPSKTRRAGEPGLRGVSLLWP